MALKKMLVWAAVLVVATLASAQISVTENSVMPIGSSWETSTMVDAATFNVGPSGANQTWTFGEYIFDNSGTGSVVDPATAPYADQFPTANRAMVSEGNTSGTFYQIEPEAVYWLGSASAAGAVVFDEAANVMPLPCSYNSEWTTVVHYSMTVGQFTISHTDSILNTVDGWGTLQTQFGSWPVLRMFSHTYMRTDNGITQPIESEYLGYIWYSASGLDLASVTSEDGETNPNFTTGFLEMANAGAAVEPVRGPVTGSFSVGQNYPNPFNPNTTLPIDLAKAAHIKVEIYDATGRIVSSRELDVAAGRTDIPIDANKWTTGNYFARVSAGNQVDTRRMLLMK